MKKSLKTIVAISALSLTLGAALAVGANAKLRMANATDGDPVGYYLVGSGSFATSAWSTTGGVQMVANGDNHGALLHQYLAAGDVFKITDGGEGWYGNDQYKSGGSDIASTGLDSINGKLEIDVQYEGDWWGNDGCNTRIVTGGSPNPAHNETIDLAGLYGKVSIYSDCDSITFYRHNGAGDYNATGADFPTDFSKTYYYKIYAKNNEGAYVKRYDKTVGLNLKVNTTGYYDIFLNSNNDIYINDAIQDWISDFMHMEYDAGGTKGEQGEGTGACTGYYLPAKQALLKLGSGAITHFRSQSKYASALERYEEWARINTDDKPFEDNGSGSSRTVALVNNIESNYTTVIILATTVALAAVGGYFLLRKARKED